LGARGTIILMAEVVTIILMAARTRVTIVFVGGAGNYTIEGGSFLYGLVQGTDTKDNYLLGTNFGDVLLGNNAQDSLKGLNGDDYISGGNKNDTLIGGEGNDYLVGGKDRSLIIKNDRDVLVVLEGVDISAITAHDFTQIV
jgi:Ca2+-binding RTX toxin-like protein